MVQLEILLPFESTFHTFLLKLSKIPLITSRSRVYGPYVCSSYNDHKYEQYQGCWPPPQSPLKHQWDDGNVKGPYGLWRSIPDKETNPNGNVNCCFACLHIWSIHYPLIPLHINLKRETGFHWARMINHTLLNET